MKANSRIFIAGHNGLVGSAIVRRLSDRGYENLLVKDRSELDLTRQEAVESYFEKERPEFVFLAAARVGGIGANMTFPADFIYSNIAIAINVIEAARRVGVQKLLNLGSSCIYPRNAPQPLKEEYLLTGSLESTNEPYAVAKIAAIKICTAFNKQHGTNFLSAMPTNIYGPGDNYDLNSSHVLPALIRKFHDAKVSGADRVMLWGDGSPYREFLYSEDLADALVYLMEHFDAQEIGEFVNIGSGEEISIRELAEQVRMAVYEGNPGRSCEVVWDAAKPGGTPRKLLDCSRLKELGWSAKTKLWDGIRKAYRNFSRGL